MLNRTRTLFFALGLLVGIAGTFSYTEIAEESSSKDSEIRKTTPAPSSEGVRQTNEFDRSRAPSQQPPNYTRSPEPDNELQQREMRIREDAPQNDASRAQGEISIVASIDKIRSSDNEKIALITVEQIVSTNESRGQERDVNPNEPALDGRGRPPLIPGETTRIRISPAIQEEISPGRYFALLRMLPVEDPSAIAIALQLRRMESDSNRD